MIPAATLIFQRRERLILFRQIHDLQVSICTSSTWRSRNAGNNGLKVRLPTGRPLKFPKQRWVDKTFFPEMVWTVRLKYPQT